MDERNTNFFASKGIGYYLTVPAIACVFAAWRLYLKNGITQFQPEINSTVVVCMLVAVGLGLVSLIADFKYIRFAAYLISLYAFMMFVYSQVTYIANVFVSIDGNSFSMGFILTVVMLLLGIILFILSGCLNYFKPWGDRRKTQ